MLTEFHKRSIDQSPLLDKLEPALRREFLRMLGAIRGEHNLRQVAELLAAGRVDVLMETVRRHAADFARDVTRGMLQAGNRAAVEAGEALGVRVRFNPMDDRVVRLVRDRELNLVREITQQQQGAIRQALVEGASTGANPIAQARAFRNSIGLTEHQESAVRNYRRLLEEGSSEALARELRDRRYDRMTARAIRGEKPLTRQQIDQMTQRYRERFLRRRSETVARTESLRAVHEGDAAAMRQMVDERDIDPEIIVREWIPGPPTRHHRSFHRNIKPVGLDEPFITGRGHRLMYPGDSSAPPEETINCRCTVATRFRRQRRAAA